MFVMFLECLKLYLIFLTPNVHFNYLFIFSPFSANYTTNKLKAKLHKWSNCLKITHVVTRVPILCMIHNDYWKLLLSQSTWVHVSIALFLNVFLSHSLLSMSSWCLENTFFRSLFLNLHASIRLSSPFYPFNLYMSIHFFLLIYFSMTSAKW